MSHIAVIGAVGLGHTIPVLPTVAELIARGHQVTYFIAGAAVPRVAATGAEVVEFDSALAGVDLTVLDTVEGMDQLMVVGLHEDTALIAAVEARFGDDRPDLLICDATRMGVGRILRRKWGVPVAAFCTVLMTNEHFSFADRVEAKRIGLPRRRPHVVKALKGLVALLAAHGQSDQTLEEFFGLREDLYISFYPRAFQGAGDTFDDRHVFVGPNLVDGADPGDWTPPPDGRPVLMVSLGTSVHRRPEFFRMCAEAFRDSEWHLIIHAHDGSDGPDLADLRDLPNVEVHAWLPQLAVLRHTDVLLCHGGVGTLMAAFAEATPVVVVPNSAEQMVNADLVTEAGLGRVLDKGAVTAQVLRGAVEELHADSGVRERVAAMRAHVRTAGGPTRAADAIDAYLERLACRRPEVAGQGI
jgi:MGT family glycosyltransferase